MAKFSLSKLIGQMVVQYFDPSLPKAGEVKMHAGSSAPSGWALCDGSELSQALYPELFAEIGSTYNTQTNPTTGAAWAAPTAGNFRVPDYRGLFLRGVGTPSGLSAVSLGGYQAQGTAKNGLAVTNNAVTSGGQSQTHTHAPAGGYNFLSGSNPNVALAGGGAGVGVSGPATQSSTTGGASVDHTHSVTSNVTLGNGDTETRPVNKGVNYIIRLFTPTMVSYNGGMANAILAGMVKPRKGQTDLTVTGTGWTTDRAKGIYYQDQDGNHRLKFNICGTVTSSTRTQYQATISGTVFKNAANFTQAISTFNNAGAALYGAYTGINAGTLIIDHASAATTRYGFSGDVELESKPSWA